MKVGIMQPYFFPHLGYWQLMLNVDVWIFFDEAQFKKRSWMTRNRILHNDPKKGSQLINIGHQKSHLGDPIKDVIVSQSNQWRDMILRRMDVYRRLEAPFFSSVFCLVEKIVFSSAESVTEQALIMQREICKYLGVRCNSLISSEMDYDRENVFGAGDWALEISKSLNADEYVNPPGGVAIFDQLAFEKSCIDLRFLKTNFVEYKQATRDFVPSLSIVDLLMFNSVKSVLSMIEQDFQILEKESLIKDADANGKLLS